MREKNQHKLMEKREPSLCCLFGHQEEAGKEKVASFLFELSASLSLSAKLFQLSLTLSSSN